MFRNYIVVAFRNFWRNKVFTLINMLGLAIGISASLIIYLLVSYEYSFDRFHKGGDRIYRVVSNMHFPDQEFKNSGSPQPLPAAIRNEVTGLEVVVHLFGYEASSVNIPQGGGQADAVFRRQKDVVFAEPDYFQLIAYKWISGDPSVLKEPYKVVLTESRAKLYFTNAAQAIGRTIVYNDSVRVTVGGLVKDLEGTSDLMFGDFVSYPTVEASGLGATMGWNEWGSVNSASQCFLRLAPGSSTDQVVKQIMAVRKKHEKNEELITEHFLQPLTDIHFNNEFGGMFSKRQADKDMLNGLLVVAGFLLLLGCINFVNLSTAQAVSRAKEIGIRKTVGGSRRQLIAQFLGETFLLIILSIVLCIALTPWLLEIFSGFIPPAINFSLLSRPDVIVFLVGLTLVLTALAGGYPSLVLSRYQPVLVLKNQVVAQGKTRRAWLRKSLTVTQFVIAQFFIIATLVMNKQIHFAMNKEMGFRKDAIVYVPIPWEIPSETKKKVLVEKMRMLPGIEKIMLAGSPPASDDVMISTVKYTDGKKEQETTVELKMADTAYFSMYKLQLLAGRFPAPADSVSELTINEFYARLLGFKNPQDAVGKVLDGDKPIVGVMKDFHYHSLHMPIQPLAYGGNRRDYRYVHVLLKPQSPDGSGWPNTIAGMQSAWKDVYPGYDFEYQFLDESIAKFYRAEQEMSRLLEWATGLTIFISCLGLFGLVLYTTNQRTKEIGIRKVLGASVAQIVSILSGDFLRLVLIAFVIAAPLAWWAMHALLQEYAYRTEMSWWVFVAGGGAMFLLALFVLCTRTIRAASANPVKSLRTE